MTLPDTATTIYCQSCGAAWKKDDDVGMYYFSSASSAIGTYVSPKTIADAAEQMTFCPHCDTDPLAAPYDKPAKGIQESPLYEGDSRMIGADTDAGEDDEGDADAVHRPD